MADEDRLSGQERGAPGLLQQMLAWIAVRPRTYGETMDAWRTSCPRLSVWEDALADGYVAVDPAPDAPHSESLVRLTPQGVARLHGRVDA